MKNMLYAVLITDINDTGNNFGTGLTSIHFPKPEEEFLLNFEYRVFTVSKNNQF